MKRFFGVFVLTPPEQRVVIVLVLVLVLAAWFKHQRDINFSPPPAENASPTASPSPNGS